MLKQNLNKAVHCCQIFWFKKFWILFQLPQRMVFYLAMIDLGFSVAHLTDHAVTYHYGEIQGGLICNVLGYIVAVTFCAQSTISKNIKPYMSMMYITPSE